MFTDDCYHERNGCWTFMTFKRLVFKAIKMTLLGYFYNVRGQFTISTNSIWVGITPIFGLESPLYLQILKPYICP